jgi:hypothetical protein
MVASNGESQKLFVFKKMLSYETSLPNSKLCIHIIDQRLQLCKFGGKYIVGH